MVVARPEDPVGAKRAISPLAGITCLDPMFGGLPGCRIFPQAGYLAGHIWPILGCRGGREHDACRRAGGRADRKL